MNPFAQKLSDEEIAELRSNKQELNRQLRRKLKMTKKTACQGLIMGVLSCETSEGRCPDYDECHPSSETSEQ